MRLLLFLFSTFYCISILYADALMVNKAMFNPSIAKYYVSDTGVKLELELTEESLQSFADIYPNSIRKLIGLKQTPIKERSQEFLKNKLYIIADSKMLTGTVVAMHGGKKIIRNEVTGEVLKVQPENTPATLYISIEYPFVSPKPNTLEFNYAASAILGFVLYHNNQVVNNYAYLSAKQVLKLDWKEPFYSAFTTNTLLRIYKYPVMGYLYLEPRLVRLESLFRVDDILNVCGSTNKDKIIKYFMQDKNLLINNTNTLPDKVILSYFYVNTSGLKLVKNTQKIDKSLLFIGISQQYFVNKLPQSVESKWIYFNKKMDKVSFNTIDPAGPYPSIIYKNDSLFKWENLIKDQTEPKIIAVRTKIGINWNLPILGETKVWSKLPTQKQSTKIIKQTLENIRTAFIEKKEDRLYKELSKVFLNQNNEVLKKELSKLFAPSAVRGGVGAIKEFGALNVDEIRELKDVDGFIANISGDVTVVAKHWGHSDKRLLKYQFIIDMIEKDGQWLIKDFSLLDLKDKI